MCAATSVKGNGDARWLRLLAIGGFVATAANAQPASHQPTWSFSVTLGGYAVGNRSAIATWLSRNGYGTTEPKRCGFDVFLRSACDPPIRYPQVSDASLLGWTLGARRSITDRVSIEVFGATEQSGTVVGRCDDLATPRDVRCTTRYREMDFGGASVATLGMINTRHFHLGAGPALLFANWDMSPAHLAGAWFDATYDATRFPIFARAQYRFYQSTSLLPAEHFTGFHPSTLYLGMGFAITLDDSPR